MADLLARLEAHDATLWPEGNVAANRLGWLELPDRLLAEAADLMECCGRCSRCSSTRTR